MYKTAFRTFARNYPLFLGAALTLAVFEAFGFDLNMGVTFGLFGLLALYSHRMVLFDEAYGWTGGPTLAQGEKLPILPFILRYGLLSGAAFALIIAIYYYAFLASGSRGNETSPASQILTSMLVASPFIAIFFALFGTALPAIAVGGNRSWGAAFSRGRRRFFATLGRLVFGPGLITVVNMAIALVMVQFATNTVLSFLISTFAYFIGFIPLHLTAVALSLAYRETEQAL